MASIFVKSSWLKVVAAACGFVAAGICIRPLVAQTRTSDWVRVGLELAQRDNETTRTYGWRAVEYGLLRLQPPDAVPGDTVQNIITRAARDGSPAALAALVAAYGVPPTLGATFS